MSMAMALEDLALGEVTLDEGATTVNAALRGLDEASAGDLYEALRAWIWKALEARRRDEELSGWMDLFSRASSRIENHSRDLAIKLEGFMELLQASIMTASVSTSRDSLQRKHVKEVLQKIYRSGGRVRKGYIMKSLEMKGANLSRVMAPLQDDGYVVRELEGRDAFYRLTMKGNEAILSLISHDDVSTRFDEKTSVFFGYKGKVSQGMVVKSWHPKASTHLFEDTFTDISKYRVAPHLTGAGALINPLAYAVSPSGLSPDSISHREEEMA